MSSKLSAQSLTNHASQNATSILAGARSSPLSRAQVEEVKKEIYTYRPHICLDAVFLETSGDKDKKTSLRSLLKTDFFTKEIDQMLIEKKCRIAVHSAKDLPEPIPEGLKIIAITKGLTPSDSLVFRGKETLYTLPKGAKIAASSKRREEAVKKLRSDFSFIDIRGNIGERLEKLEKGEVDAVVIAEAALIRLFLTHLPRVCIPGETTPLQGKLAILARDEDEEMAELFCPLDTRKTSLYLGINCPESTPFEKYLHYSIIKTVPREESSFSIEKASFATHLLFTSQEAVKYFFRLTYAKEALCNKIFVAVGKKTASLLNTLGFKAEIVPQQETAEGIIQELEKKDLREARFFWPHSSLSRPALKNFFLSKKILFEEVILYDTLPFKREPFPALETFDQLVFTSPSTVDAFLHFFKGFPKRKTLKAIGPITADYLSRSELKNPKF